MTGIEDIIGKVMAAHDSEAPSGADLMRALSQASGHRPPASRRPAARRYLVPLTAAVAVAAVAAGIAWASGEFGVQRPATANGTARPVRPLSCPARYSGTGVPAQPAHVDGRSGLVPSRMPDSTVICAYSVRVQGRRKASWALSGRRKLTRGLGQMTELLSLQPRALPGQQFPCALPVEQVVYYLIGLTYPGHGKLWVGASTGTCGRAFNGEFVSLNTPSGPVAQAYASGRWPAQPPVSCHGADVTSGRLGQERQMVPGSPASLLICARGGRTYTAGFGSLVTALNALPTVTSTEGCSEVPGPNHLTELYFSYQYGPPVNVAVFSGCSPAIDNQSLQAKSASTILPIIQRLLGG